MSHSLTVELVNTDGHIDLEASCQAFRAAALKAQAELETEQTQIAAATNELFDQNLGQSIPMPTLGSMVALQKLNSQPENFKTLSERVLEYVRANSKGDDSLFVINKGKNGGVSRRIDRATKSE